MTHHSHLGAVLMAILGVLTAAGYQAINADTTHRGHGFTHHPALIWGTLVLGLVAAVKTW